MDLTLIVFILFLLSSAKSQQSECENSRKCEKFGLDSLEYSRRREFSRAATCCVQKINPGDPFYSKENGISGLDKFPPAVDKHNVRMEIYYDSLNNYELVMNLSWTYPLCRDGAMGIKGFNINFMNKDISGDATERLLFFNFAGYINNRERLSIEYHFRSNILQNDTDFSVVIGSVPEDNYQRQNNFVEVSGSTKYRAEMTKDSIGEQVRNGAKRSFRRVIQKRSADLGVDLQSEIDTWRPNWTMTNSTFDNRLYTLNIHFIQPSCEYNFRYYRFRIYNCSDDLIDCYKTDPISKRYGEGADCQFESCELKEYKNTTVSFKSIVPGNYRISLDVWAKVPLFIGSRTNKQYLLIEIEVSDFIPSFLPPIVTKAPKQGEVHHRGGSPDSTQIISIVAGTLVALFLVVLVFGIFCFMKKRGERNKYSPHISSRSTTIDLFPANNTNSVPPLVRKSVTVVSSTDHPMHHFCVKMLVDFLKINCCCDVSWWGLDLQKMMRSKAHYILTSLGDEADFIMCIHSEGAYKKYKLLRDTDDAETYESKEVDIAGDFFVQAISTLNQLAVQPNHSKLINAYFSYTSKDHHIINDLKKDTPLYRLMDKIDKICMHIHGLSEDHPWIKQIKDYWELNNGMALKDHIDVFKKRQAENPNWFEQSHFRAPHGKQSSNLQRESEIEPEKYDSGLGRETRNSDVDPFYDDPDERDVSLANSSMFPFSFDNCIGHDLQPPVDLYEGEGAGARPKIPNSKPANKKPQNNTAVAPLHGNMCNTDSNPFNSSRMPLTVANNSNNTTLPLSDRQPGAHGSAPEWGAHPSVHSYQNPSLGNPIHNQNHKPQGPPLTNSRNPSLRNTAPKRRNRNPSGGSSSNSSSIGPKSRNSSGKSNGSNPMYHSGGPFRAGGTPLHPLDGPRAAEAAPLSSGLPHDYNDFETPEDMSFCGPAMSDDTSSIDSHQQQLELIQINEEFDFNNGGDSGTGSIDGGDHL